MKRENLIRRSMAVHKLDIAALEHSREQRKLAALPVSGVDADIFRARQRLSAIEKQLDAEAGNKQQRKVVRMTRSKCTEYYPGAI